MIGERRVIFGKGPRQRDFWLIQKFVCLLLLNIIDCIIRVNMLRLLPTSVSGLARSCRTVARRQLFTDQYLGLVSYKELRLQQLERLKERQNLPRLRSVIFSSADAGQLLSSGSASNSDGNG